MDSAAPPGLSLVTVCSLLACCLQVLAAVLLTHRYGGQSSAEDRWVLLWLFYDVIVHLTLVGGASSSSL
uniref:EBP like n=1 Tax=Acanthochromis polyacanthus TaxID=80966 RepID=A0A3Q1EQ86_9TELE